MSRDETEFNDTRKSHNFALLTGSRPRHQNKRVQKTDKRDILDALEKLVPLWPEKYDLSSTKQRANILERIRQALRRERARGLQGHWTYNLARHSQLLKLFQDIKHLPPITVDSPQTLKTTKTTKKPNQAT